LTIITRRSTRKADYVEAYLNRGLAKFDLEDYKEAANDFTRA